MRTSVLPPLTGSALLDPWRLRYREQLASGAQVARSRRPTRSEELLWEALQTGPREWTAEHPTVHGYTLDFFCAAARLAVEVDGGSHWGAAASAHDAWRDEVHGRLGIRTHRFSAVEVETDLAWVAAEVEALAAAREAALAAGGGEVRVAAAERPRTRVRVAGAVGDPAPVAAGGVSGASGLRGDTEESASAVGASALLDVTEESASVGGAPALCAATENAASVASVSSEHWLTVKELTARVAAEVERDERLLAFPPAPPGWSSALSACRTVLPAQAARRTGLQGLFGR